MSKEIGKELIDLFESEDGYLFEPPKKAVKMGADERLAESFNEIQEFVDKFDKVPEINSDDINEAKLAHRLNSIKSNKSKIGLLKPIDRLGLLDEPEAPETIDDLFEKDPYGLFAVEGTTVLNLSSTIKKQQRPIIEEKAKRKRSKDFEQFKPLFIEKQKGLAEGNLKLVYFTSVDQIKEGGFYVQDGIMLYVAEFGKTVKIYNHSQQRLRIVYENGVESNMYRRSLAQRLYEGGLVVVDKNNTENIETPTDIVGYIYVLKTKSTDEKIKMVKDLYKIGFTTTPISERIKNALNDPTYLMADVEIAASFIVTGEYNTQKVEHFIHRIFADAAMDLIIIDGDGKEYKPKEWYSAPLYVIEQAVNMLNSGEIIDYVYDSKTMSMRYVGSKDSH